MAAQKTRKCKICKRKFVVKHDTSTITQRVCSCKCAVKLYDNLPKPKGRKAPKEIAKSVGRRSMAEVRFDARFIEGKKNVKAEYETDTFTYPIQETRKYTPDWTLTTKSGKKIYLEFKGVLDVRTRKKMKLIKTEYPSMDIRIIFEKASNKISKTSKTTYGEWADQWGFPWADNVLPKDWINE